MVSLQSQFRRIHILFFSLLILFCITAAPDRQWAKAPAAAQCPAITLGPNLVQNGTVGSPYSLNLTASGGRAPYAYSRISGTLPTGLLLSSGGSLGGTPTQAAGFSFRIRATDADGCPGEKSYMITFSCPTITLNPASLPAATTGVSYSRNLSASGGQAPYTYSLSGGTIPPGLLFSSSGLLAGTPTTAGAYSFAVRATDANGCSGSLSYGINVTCLDITLNPATLPAGSLGVPYSQTVTASGGQTPYSFSIITGSLPAGLTLTPANGRITGTPVASGTYSFIVKATDAANCVGVRAYSIVVGCPDIAVAPATLSSGTVGASYSQNLSASGGQGPYTFSLFVNPLPPGLSLSSSGSITGTPTSAGSYGFTLRVRDANDCLSSRAYTIVIDPGCPPITITPLGLPDASTGIAYSQPLNATGGGDRYSFSIVANSLPPGLTLLPTGMISGTPTTTGTYSFQVQATGPNGCTGTRAYTIVVNCGTITLTPGSLPNATVGVPYSQTVSASGTRPPYGFTSTGTLPPGITLNSFGALLGTPTAAGNYSFSLRVSDGNNCFTDKPYTINVTCPTITVNPANLPAGTVGAAYSQTFSATGGTAPYLFGMNISALPPGLTFNTNGSLSGTPTAAGSYSFIVQGNDANGCSGGRSYTLVINQTCPTITVNPATLPAGITGTAYNQTFTATGGAASYAFSLSTGTLPTGLSLGSTGNLTGTPTAAGNYSFSVLARDANNCVGSRAYTIEVTCPTITVNPLGALAGRVGEPYSWGFFASGGRSPYTFTLAAGTLPPGLTLAAGNLSNSWISGTPTTEGSSSFTLRATDANGCTGEHQYTIVVVCPGIPINPATLPEGMTGTAYNQTLSARGGSASYAFSISTGTLPPGLSLSSSGNLTGTPTTAGSYNFTVHATEAYGCVGLRVYTLVINNPACPTITLNPATLPAGTTGAAYSQTLSATGGAAAYAFSVTTGNLPTGLSLALNGALTGTPAAASTYSFTVRATDANGCTGERSYTLAINNPVCPTITLNPASPLPAGRIATPYNQTITATGGVAPYAFSLATGSSLPAGLTLSTAGSLSGTPTAGGNFSFTIVATDANGCLGSRLYILFIDPCPLITINPADPNLAPATISTAYSVTFSATGGAAPYSFSLINVLPLGLTLNPATGVLSGSPTQSGNFNFNVRATDANGCLGSRAYALIVNSTCPAITVNPTNPNLPPGTVGTPYSQTFSATGGATPYRVDRFVGTPTPGLNLDFTTGVLSGTPTAPGTFTFTIGFKDAGQCPGERTYTLIINNPACPTITVNPATLPAGTTGSAYSQTLSATGGAAAYSFSIATGSLPSGLSLASNGALTGTPTAAGTYNFNARATDANGCTGERGYTIVINNPACPTITVNPASLPGGTTGAAYNQTLTATGGTAAYAFSVTTGNLPTGLSLASNGALTGTPTAAGTYNFNARATDANGCTGERGYTIVISNPACPTITVNPASLPAGRTGAAYNQTLTATGGAAAYAFSISTGTLPTGLSLASNGALAGTPSAAGTYTFSVRATDANGCAGERPYTIAVGNPECPAIALNPTTLPAATTGTAYNQTVTATGGAGSYAFSVSSGALPAGVSLAASGSMTGAPSAAGSFSFTVRATNAGGCTGERSYTIAVANNLVTSVSAASFSASGGLAPESIVAAFGSNMATSTQIATTLPLPTTLAGVTLKVRDSAGVERLAPLFFVSTTQINSQIPPGTVAGSASVTVENGAGNFSPAAVVATGTIEVATVSPGLFSADASGRSVAAANVLRIKADGTQSYEAIARFDAAQNRFVAVPIDLGPATDQVFLVLYGTGFKFRSALSAVGCAIGGVSSEVLYAGEVAGLAGLDQINARLSRSLAGRGEVDVVIVVDGRTANTVRVAVR